MQIVTIKGREYTVEALDLSDRPNLAADMQRRGWEPTSYLLTGKRGATFNAYRSARTGELVVICRI